MKSFKEKLEEVAKMLSPSFAAERSNKIRSYQALFELATTNSDTCSMQLLGDSANVVVSLLISDVISGDEEMGSLALKCLGSMLYHPSIVPKITGENAVIIIDSLVKIITTTRKKSVCKLAVWCISVQQFDEAFLNAHFHSLLKAIVRALDNPIGSLSVTYEAMQAVMKLAPSCGEKMTEMSNSWAPPIYRRLVSVDNRDREMAEKCLLKIKFMICPAPTSLLQTLLLDVKDNMLPAMAELLNNGMKVQAMKAWKWFAYLLGPGAMNSKHLVNKMLKIAEQAFADADPQVQIAGLVSWEAIIDVFLSLPTQASKSDLVPLSAGSSCPNEAEKFLRKIKLIMTPLIGIMSTKFDISVHLTCLNTWYYLLHKLDTSVSSDLVIQSVWEPLLEVVFKAEPDNGSALLWNICLDMLDAFTNAKNSHSNDIPQDNKSSILLEKTSVIEPGPLASNKGSWKSYAIKWSPWNLHQLDFFIRRICSFLSQASNVAISQEFKQVAHNAALKLFRSLLRAVNSVINSTSTSCDEIMLCMKAVFGFLKKICENETLEDGKSLDSINVPLQLLEMVAEELEPSIMGSPLYKMAVDLKGFDKLDRVGKLRYSSPTGIHFVSCMDMVIPIVYLNVLFFSVAKQLSSEATDPNTITDRIYGNVKFCFCSYDALEILHLFVGLLFKYEAFDCLAIWRTLSICLKDYVDDKTRHSLLIIGSNNLSYPIVLYFLTYPFSMLLHPIRHKVPLQDLMDAWKQLYVSLNHDIRKPCSPVDNFTEDLSSVLNGYLDDVAIMSDKGSEVQRRENEQETDTVLFIGNIGVCVLEQFLFRVRIKQTSDSWISANVRSCMKFSSRLLKLAMAEGKFDAPKIQPLTIRMFSTLIQFISSLNFKGDILAFVEAMESPLLEWMSLGEIKDGGASCQLQSLWTEILNSFLRSQPSMKFDSSFLVFQASLLEKTLDHWNLTISATTINFWNSTYGGEPRLDLEYPKNLHSILDKLYRNGKIYICRTKLAIGEQSHSRITSSSALKKCRVYAAQEEEGTDLQGQNEMQLSCKRRKVELTEHQKDVRRAQQGRSRDCSGHGPGIRTYTSVDFSQGNEEESQESQMI